MYRPSEVSSDSLPNSTDLSFHRTESVFVDEKASSEKKEEEEKPPSAGSSKFSLPPIQSRHGSAEKTELNMELSELPVSTLPSFGLEDRTETTLPGVTVKGTENTFTTAGSPDGMARDEGRKGEEELAAAGHAAAQAAARRRSEQEVLNREGIVVAHDEEEDSADDRDDSWEEVHPAGDDGPVGYAIHPLNEEVQSQFSENVFLQRSKPEVATDSETVPDFSTIPDCSLPPLDADKQLQNIMDCVLPPRTFSSDGQVWRAHTATTPCTRLDLVALEERFDVELVSRRAKAYGICPIRRDLFDQMFDELIRQVTVSCAERGLLLLRVRDEIRMSLVAYQSVLESAIAYGLRKAISVENEQTRAVVERDEERGKNMQLVARIQQLEKQLANDKLVNEEELEILEQRMREENERLAESNKTLKHQLQAILQMEHVTQQSAELPPQGPTHNIDKQ